MEHTAQVLPDWFDSTSHAAGSGHEGVTLAPSRSFDSHPNGYAPSFGRSRLPPVSEWVRGGAGCRTSAGNISFAGTALSAFLPVLLFRQGVFSCQDEIFSLTEMQMSTKECRDLLPGIPVDHDGERKPSRPNWMHSCSGGSACG